MPMPVPTPVPMPMPITLNQLPAASSEEATHLLGGLYEHSPWVATAALLQRPFASLAQLKYAMTQVLGAWGSLGRLHWNQNCWCWMSLLQGSPLVLIGLWVAPGVVIQKADIRIC